MTIELDKIVSKYRDKGFVAGLPVFSRTETDEILNYIEGPVSYTHLTLPTILLV